MNPENLSFFYSSFHTKRQTKNIAMKFIEMNMVLFINN